MNRRFFLYREEYCGWIGKLECDFIIRNRDMNYSYVQVAYTIALSKETEDREFRPLEMIKDNYPKYVMTTDYLLQNRNGILHINILDYMTEGKEFSWVKELLIVSSTRIKKSDAKYKAMIVEIFVHMW